MISPGEWIGIIGGGQLGRMMIHAASRMGYQTLVFSDQPDSPATHVANRSIVAPYEDLDAITEFAKQSAVVTFEFENIPFETVQKLEEETIVRPNWKALYTSQNRLREKRFVKDLGIETADFYAVNDVQQLQTSAAELKYSCILKTTELGYDGKGQYRIEKQSQLEEAWDMLNGTEGIVEQQVLFAKEVSVVAARGANGEFVPFVPVENIHRDGILDTTIAPATLSSDLAQESWTITRRIMDALDYIGILAVEFFVTHESELLVNEFAPRPHNSGHWTIDACCTNQFEQHIRAICGCPLGDPVMHSRAEMRNLLGLDSEDWNQYLCHPSTKLHLYGKKECKPGRKMGHITKTTGW